MMPSRQLYVIAAIVVAGILLLVSYVLRQEIKQVLSPKDQSITELYISAMPRPVGSKTNFTFTLHNLMGKEFAYSYVVYVKGSKNEYAVLDNSSVVIADTDTVTIEENVTVPIAGATLYVELPQLGQQIHLAL